MVSFAEHAVMCVLNLMRNFVPQYKQVDDVEIVSGAYKAIYETPASES